MGEPKEPKKTGKDHGVEATNQEFARYDQVEKRQGYALAEGGRVEEFDEEFRIRTVDMRPFFRGGPAGREQFARELGEALREIGFAILVGHGVDPAIHERIEAAIESFFAGHTPAEKLRFTAARHGSVNQGWFPLKETSDIHPD